MICSRQEVLKLIADCCEVPLESISSDENFTLVDKGLSSLSLVEFAISASEKWNLDIYALKIEEWQTIDDIYNNLAI